MICILYIKINHEEKVHGYSYVFPEDYKTSPSTKPTTFFIFVVYTCEVWFISSFSVTLDKRKLGFGFLFLIKLFEEKKR